VPEGPSIVILREETARFVGRGIVNAESHSKGIQAGELEGQPIVALRSWGKHFLIQLPQLALRIHFLLFGSYRINERKPGTPRLSLRFDDGDELNFYACSIKPVNPDLDAVYDWRGDIMADEWNAALARKKLRAMPAALACDALLDQDVFAGAGNIIKNEVLFRIRVHPLSLIGALPPRKLAELVDQTRAYAFEFLQWKKDGVLKAHWLAHTKSTCPRCHIPFHKAQLGKTRRRSFFCERCQRDYQDATEAKT
jgi:endonuclease-8